MQFCKGAESYKYLFHGVQQGERDGETTDRNFYFDQF